MAAEKKKIFFFLNQNLQIYLYLGIHKEHPSYKRSLQLSKEAIQLFKTWTFNFFLLLWVIFAPWIRIRIPNPDPLTRLNPDPIRICIRKPAFQQLNVVSSTMRRSGKTMWKRQFYLTQDRLSFLYADNQKAQVWSLALPSLSSKKAFYYYYSLCVVIRWYRRIAYRSGLRLVPPRRFATPGQRAATSDLGLGINRIYTLLPREGWKGSVSDPYSFDPNPGPAF
jgi:hypothetical protein